MLTFLRRLLSRRQPAAPAALDEHNPDFLRAVYSEPTPDERHRRTLIDMGTSFPTKAFLALAHPAGQGELADLRARIAAPTAITNHQYFALPDDQPGHRRLTTTLGYGMVTLAYETQNIWVFRPHPEDERYECGMPDYLEQVRLQAAITDTFAYVAGGLALSPYGAATVRPANQAMLDDFAGLRADANRHPSGPAPIPPLPSEAEIVAQARRRERIQHKARIDLNRDPDEILANVRRPLADLRHG